MELKIIQQTDEYTIYETEEDGITTFIYAPDHAIEDPGLNLTDEELKAMAISNESAIKIALEESLHPQDNTKTYLF